MRFLVVALVVVLAVATQSQAAEQQWLFKDSQYSTMLTQFLAKFKKAVSATQIPKVLSIFKANVDKITKANAQKKVVYAVNEFADLDAAQFQRLYLGARPPTSASLLEAGGEAEAAVEMSEEAFEEAMNTGFDWSTKDILLPARHQRQCGSCWAFTAAATIEGAIAIAGGKKQHISTQAMVDCTKSYGCLGCKGGYATGVYNHASKVGYFAESDAPYLMKESGSCPEKQLTPLGKVKEYKKVSCSASKAGDCTKANIAAVAKNPLWMTMDANTIQFYRSGIVTNNGTAKCTNNINHAVVMIGYGTEDGTQYYKIRNSWGPDWGESGNFRIIADGTCAFHAWPAYYPVLKK